MNVNITIDDTDTDLVSGFCSATRMPADGVPGDWLNQKVDEYIRQNARQGLLMDATAAARATYAQALKDASIALSQTLGRVIITKPPVG